MIPDRLILAFAVFALGYLAGNHTAAPVPKVCPEVAGQRPISTATTSDGEYCYYQAVQRGRITKEKKL